MSQKINRAYMELYRQDHSQRSSNKNNKLTILSPTNFINQQQQQVLVLHNIHDSNKPTHLLRRQLHNNRQHYRTTNSSRTISRSLNKSKDRYSQKHQNRASESHEKMYQSKNKLIGFENGFKLDLKFEEQPQNKKTFEMANFFKTKKIKVDHSNRKIAQNSLNQRQFNNPSHFFHQLDSQLQKRKQIKNKTLDPQNIRNRKILSRRYSHKHNSYHFHENEEQLIIRPILPTSNKAMELQEEHKTGIGINMHNSSFHVQPGKSLTIKSFKPRNVSTSQTKRDSDKKLLGIQFGRKSEQNKKRLRKNSGQIGGWQVSNEHHYLTLNGHQTFQIDHF